MAEPLVSGSAPATRRISWRPLLEDDLAERATRRVSALAERLLALPHPVADADPSLVGGSAGTALAHHYLSDATGMIPHRRRAIADLNHAEQSVRAARLDSSLHSGFTGVAWAVQHLGRSTHTDGLDRLEPVDDTLVTGLGRRPRLADYDLLNGLAGIGIYALERLDRPSGSVLAELVIARLEDRAQARPAGSTWVSPPSRLPPWITAAHPRGVHNVGMAHGPAGVVPFLASCCAVGVSVARAKPLLEAAVSWVLDQRGETEGARFPSLVTPEGRSLPATPGGRPVPARTSWCYGDPGIAAALSTAGLAVDRPDWVDVALELAVDAAHRPLEATEVVDASLCHGAAGLGHVFNRMYQATGEPALGESARRWFARALDMPDPRHRSGFLQGLHGLALSLAAATADTDPGWDRILALSVPGQVPGRRDCPGAQPECD